MDGFRRRSTDGLVDRGEKTIGGQTARGHVLHIVVICSVVCNESCTLGEK